MYRLFVPLLVAMGQRGVCEMRGSRTKTQRPKSRWRATSSGNHADFRLGWWSAPHALLAG